MEDPNSFEQAKKLLLEAVKAIGRANPLQQTTITAQSVHPRTVIPSHLHTVSIRTATVIPSQASCLRTAVIPSQASSIRTAVIPSYPSSSRTCTSSSPHNRMWLGKCPHISGTLTVGGTCTCTVIVSETHVEKAVRFSHHPFHQLPSSLSPLDLLLVSIGSIIRFNVKVRAHLLSTPMGVSRRMVTPFNYLREQAQLDVVREMPSHLGL